jgi:TRAP transporter TAXI family solute receptor
VAGEGPFAQGGALTSLRAVGGLFPEAIHVVVRSDSQLQDVSQLRGTRVNLGTPASGSHYDATAVLAAYGLTPDDLAETRTDDLTTAIRRLQRRQIDALFVTALAPMRPLQQMAVDSGFRLLPITGPPLERLIQARQGLTPLILPANTYPGQKEAAPTAASVATLVTTQDAPEGEVARIADLVFARSPKTRSERLSEVVKTSGGDELRGITIPLHPGASLR